MIGRKAIVRIGLIALFLSLGFYLEGYAAVHYTVKPGDTLYDISKSFSISVKVLKKTNHLNRNAIRPGQVFLIPTPEERQRGQENKTFSMETEYYRIRKGDTLFSISKKTGHSMDEIKKRNDLHSTSLKRGQILTLPKTEVEIEEGLEEVDPSEIAVKESSGNGNGNGSHPEISEPLGKWSHLGERNLFVKVVKTYLGAPYRLGGSTLKGIDCSAFVKKVYEIFNVSLPRTAQEQFRVGKKVEKYQLEEGDLVFFKRGKNNAHVGIYIGENQFIHASSSSKEIKIDNLETPYYSQRFLRGVRVMELEFSEPMI
jgi:LysM repeat protein